MIENNDKKYYTTYEIADLINDESTEIHKVWNECYPNFQNVVLVEQVNRILYEAKKYKKVSVAEFTKSAKGTKKYFAFLIDDVIEYVKNREILHKTCNLKFIDKE